MKGARRSHGPLDYSRRLWMRITLWLSFAFLYAPIAILVVYSFNDSRRNIVWRGFTLGEMMLPCIVLLGVGAVAFLIGTRAFRWTG